MSRFPRAEFLISAAAPGQFPADHGAELAFVGRSNAGKSTAINVIVQRQGLARTSKTPGRTRLLNFFELAPTRRLVDLPGYGFAEVSKSDVEHWTALIHLYLRGRASLQRTLLLIDARHGIKEPDRPLMKLLDEAAVSYQAVLTKIDKVKPAELADRVATVAAELAKHVAAHPVIHLTSAHEGIGIAALRASLSTLAAPAQSR